MPIKYLKKCLVCGGDLSAPISLLPAKVGNIASKPPFCSPSCRERHDKGAEISMGFSVKDGLPVENCLWCDIPLAEAVPLLPPDEQYEDDQMPFCSDKHEALFISCGLTTWPDQDE